MTHADLFGIASLLALAPTALLAALRYNRRARAPLQREARAVVDAAFGPRLARGQRPPADGRWHRLLREAHRTVGDRLRPVLLSEYWLADSEARQWHCAVQCDGVARPLLRVVALTATPAGLKA